MSPIMVDRPSQDLEQIKLDARPIRVKMSKDWRGELIELPKDTMYVGRPSKWCNPYPLSKYKLATALALYKMWLGKKMRDDPEFLEPLRGKNLACWCKLDAKCHADILLERANK